jgi:hypothetical protein
MKTTPLLALTTGFASLLALPASAAILAFVCFAASVIILLSAEYGRPFVPPGARRKSGRARRESLRLAA